MKTCLLWGHAICAFAQLFGFALGVVYGSWLLCVWCVLFGGHSVRQIGKLLEKEN